ncbi:uncharacterized protein LOC112010074 [Quercus suber]|uniref:uncharacterized protein LOC112010074 n=1 Tax=Quercus suber TaxID=58331 RepID=UPI000CE28289|nr:uncharacterized protein LOC112010074 [Quercus suber]
MYWHQRSRVSWMQHRDRNSKYFHVVASQRRRSNKISKLKVSNGSWITQQSDLEFAASQYFQEIFSSASSNSFHQVIQHMDRVVTPYMNSILLEEFIEDEVRTTIFQMHPTKAPGPDERVIIDNILISFETLHYMKTKRWGTSTHMALKLNMSKAYDRVKWYYLKALMLRMGFHPRWVNLVLDRISSVSYSVIVSGEAFGFIKPFRGIRQVYYFARHPLQNVKPSKKSLVHMSWLGDRRGKKQASAEIKLRIQSKLSSWKGKFLSQVGKEVLIKSVAQAIPTYARNCFLFPNGLCNELNSIMGQFWWGLKEVEKKMHWLSRKHLCFAKKDAGMGFRDLKCFNLVLLAKQGWRLLHCQDSLFFRIFKSKYFPNGSFLEAAIPSHASYAWCSIAQSQNLLIQGSRWRVGTGSSINIWQDKWLPMSSNQKVLSPRTFDARVSDLINGFDFQPRWKGTLIYSIFFPFEADIIKSILLSVKRLANSLIWTKNRRGVFSVQSTYFLQREIEEAANRNMASTSNAGS